MTKAEARVCQQSRKRVFASSSSSNLHSCWVNSRRSVPKCLLFECSPKRGRWKVPLSLLLLHIVLPGLWAMIVCSMQGLHHEENKTGAQRQSTIRLLPLTCLSKCPRNLHCKWRLWSDGHGLQIWSRRGTLHRSMFWRKHSHGMLHLPSCSIEGIKQICLLLSQNSPGSTWCSPFVAVGAWKPNIFSYGKCINLLPVRYISEIPQRDKCMTIIQSSTF